mmetsp:Transcript_58764/g.108460  ORF Transcript_58764/g.108460 Transcript_58764/m.108460 type:complete len:236 (+) Transcript_58764:70-777(+)
MATVSFDVGGTIKKVLAQVVRSKPETLLCTLLDDPANKRGAKEPIFIDRSAELFDAILDWYRHGFILLPPGVGVERMKLECAYYALPDSVEIRLEDPGSAMYALSDWHTQVMREVADEVENLKTKHRKIVQSLVATIAYGEMVAALPGLASQTPQQMETGLQPQVSVGSQVSNFRIASPTFGHLAMPIDSNWWKEVSNLLHERGQQNGLECALHGLHYHSGSVKLVKRKREDPQA